MAFNFYITITRFKYFHLLIDTMKGKLYSITHYSSQYSWLILVAIITMVYAVVLTPHGLEIQNDSCSYIRGAINIKQGIGFTYAGKYISHFPAGISMLYANLSTWVNASITDVALWSHIASLFLLGILFKYLMRQLNIAEPIQIIGIILYLFSTPTWNIASKLLTELHTMVIVGMCTLMLFRLLKNNNEKYHLFIIGLLFGIGILVRFAMIGLLGGFVLVLLWQSKQDWKKGLLQSIYIGVAPLLMVVAYSWYVKINYNQESVDRILLWHPISLKKISLFLRTPFSWILDVEYTKQSTLLILGGLSILILFGILGLQKIYKTSIKTRAISTPMNPMYVAMAIISLVYCIFLVISISLFDAATPVDTRILSPLSIYFYLAIIGIFNVLYRNSPFQSLSVVGLLGLSFILNWTATYALPQRYKNPFGYSKPYWQVEARRIICDSQEIWIRQNRKIVTNGYYVWRLMDDRPTFKIPEIYNAFQLVKNTNIHNDLVLLKNEIANDNAQLVYFFNMRRYSNQIPKEKLFTYFNDSSRFCFTPFEKGIIIQGKKRTLSMYN